MASSIPCLSKDFEVPVTPGGQLNDRRGKVGGMPR